MYVNVKDLPATAQRALDRAGYRKHDINVEARDTFTMEKSYGAGHRAFTIVLNIETGESTRHEGSWGGANPFETRRTEVDESAHPIPMNGAAILGQESVKVSARVVVRPDQIAKFLPPIPDVTSRDQSILAIYASIKPGQYRADSLMRAKVLPEEIATLVSRGFLKVNAAGATSITTAGKNARGNARVL